MITANARRNLRDRRWRAMTAPHLFALKTRLEARGIPVPSILFERLRIEIKAMERDSVYRAKVLRDAAPNGRPLPRATYSNNPRAARR